MNWKRFADNADFWSGCLFLAFGAAAIFFSQDFPMGTARRMGPGYFPHYIGVILMILGVIIGVRGVLAPGESIGRWALRPLLVLGTAVLLFGLTIEHIGFVPALATVIVGSTLAGREIRPFEVAALTVVLVCGAVAVFIYGLGLPYRLFWWY